MQQLLPCMSAVVALLCYCPGIGATCAYFVPVPVCLCLRVCVCVCAVRAVWWHVIAGTAFVALLPAIAPIHQSASWVFTTFSPDKAFTGIDNNGFLFLLSLLGSQWAMGEYC